jgi:agmatinase
MTVGDLDLKEPERRFADCDSDFKSGKYVVYGVPFDATVSHTSGASRAPEAIRKETYNFETYLMDLDVDLEEIPMVDIGDLVLENTEEGQAKILSETRSISSFVLEQGKFPIMIGGEHSVTEGAVDGFMQLNHSRGGIVVIVDAHLDFREEYLENPHSHACVTRRLFERWGRDSVVVIGVRSGSKSEIRDADRLGLRYVTSKQVRQEGIHWVVESWDGALSLRDRPVYLSIDIDGLDPSNAPGTGTPEPWGLTSLDLLHLIEELKRNTLAMDIVEVSPKVEKFITPGLAGKMIRQMIGLKEMVDRNPTWLEKV